ncbi:MAG TPA: hypothetical protein VMK12_22615, partial [Anaeromyxobacteraceae bacterium]|nr:hypothetical protein [Anaeromyxobacteraceae bacterium]
MSTGSAPRHLHHPGDAAIVEAEGPVRGRLPEEIEAASRDNPLKRPATLHAEGKIENIHAAITYDRFCERSIFWQPFLDRKPHHLELHLLGEFLREQPFAQVDIGHEGER